MQDYFKRKDRNKPPILAIKTSQSLRLLTIAAGVILVFSMLKLEDRTAKTVLLVLAVHTAVITRVFAASAKHDRALIQVSIDNMSTHYSELRQQLASIESKLDSLTREAESDVRN